ncbi:ABC transporter ATP-binding protein [Verminephrobacter aporrectodeae subsp. tuberculatae]|uniref:ABC transporter ATP-binding protein n=1 Tax=Verminephrobacter aporrectodeae TaxID=1110389 RepID=UPI002237C089|nr:ABC transporter ATP-binding protein [Verminephrobacter aporrectodeae]MCW5287687.1 ABC transporter ATP-binding protein [Verminephrobacter aporrectodeae subsp. tuberculatae]
MACVTLRNVSKIYDRADRYVVKSVNMQIGDGEIVSLLGSSGCGKTSTLRMIAGFETLSEGSIRIGDRAIDQLAPAERNVAMAFEGYALYPPLSVHENIAFSLLRGKTPREQVRARVRQVAELLEITDILDSYPPTLSGGQQQRVSLARALVRHADLHLLDEPMSQLEPQLRALLRARIKDYLVAHRMTVLCVTHDQTEAMALSDRIAVMSDGVLQQFATTEDLKERPANLFVAGFIGEPAMNLLPARVSRRGSRIGVVLPAAAGTEALRLDLGDSARVPAADGLRDGHAVHLGVRPHKVRVGTAPAGDNTNTLHGTLAFNQWQGDQSHIGIHLGGPTLLLVVTDGAVDLAEHSPVTLDLPQAALHLFDSHSGRALLHGADL